MIRTVKTKDIFKPDLAIHPGKTLEETLVVFGMTQTDLAKRTGLTPKTINEIVKEKISISPETAIKLASVFGTSPTFWNNLERQYQETAARLELEERLVKEIHELSKFPYENLLKEGCVADTKERKERVRSLLEFFGVSSLVFVSGIFDFKRVAFRQSPHGKNISEENLVSWIKCGEAKGRQIEMKEKFDKEALNALLPSLRELTREPFEYAYKKAVELCASAGVAFVIVPHFESTYVNGATRYFLGGRALVQLSMRNPWQDIFWFTFFHEIGHILKHGKKMEFIEYESPEYKMGDKDEEEADDFAQKVLIKEKDFNDFKKKQDFSLASVKKFADQIKVDPGIVGGRLAHELSKLGNPNGWREFRSLRKKLPKQY